MNVQHKLAIQMALIEGVKAARTEIDIVKMKDKLDKSDKLHIETMDEWIVEMLDALHWMKGDEYREMERVYQRVKASPALIHELIEEGGKR